MKMTLLFLHISKNVGFQALFDQPKVASLDDVLILNDNFDTPIHIDPRFTLPLNPCQRKTSFPASGRVYDKSEDAVPEPGMFLPR